MEKYYHLQGRLSTWFAGIENQVEKVSGKKQIFWVTSVGVYETLHPNIGEYTLLSHTH